MTQAITQTASKAAIMTSEADNLINNAMLVLSATRSGSLVLKQPIFDWNMADKYKELSNLETEVKNIFMTKSYNTQESMRVLIEKLNSPHHETIFHYNTLN